jgi:hypothetical protein
MTRARSVCEEVSEGRRETKFEEDCAKVVVGHPVVGLLLIQEDQSAFNLVFGRMSKDRLNGQGNVRSRTTPYKTGLVRVKQTREHLSQPTSQNPRKDLGVAVGQSNRSPVADKAVITVGLRQERHSRGKPRLGRLGTGEEESQQGALEEGKVGAIPFVRQAVRAGRLAEGELTHHRRKLSSGNGCRQKSNLLRTQGGHIQRGQKGIARVGVEVWSSIKLRPERSDKRLPRACRSEKKAVVIPNHRQP